MSRIWQALKEAERQKSRAEVCDSAPKPTTEPAPDPAPEDSDRRKGLRHAHSVPVLVYGSGVDKQPFHEDVDTIDAHDNGCSLILEAVVSRGQRLFLSNTLNQAEQECHVVHIGRRSRGKARVGVAFLTPAPHFWRRV